MAAPTPLLFRRRELAAKVETTKGTSVALAAADAKYLVINPRITPEYQMFSREYLQSSLSWKGHVVTRKTARLEFSLEMRRQNTGTTTADAMDVLLQGCAIIGTANVNKIDYLPVSALSSQKTLTMQLNMDGFNVKLKGCMGTVEFVGQIGQPMLANFTFFGVLDTANDLALYAGTITHEAAVPGAFQGITLTINSKTPCVANVNINVGNEVVPRLCANNSGGVEFFFISGRQGEVTFDPEMNTEADADGLDYWDDLAAGTLFAWDFTLASGGTNHFKFSAPKTQIKSIGDEEREGLAVASLTCGLAQNAGDDELKIEAL